MRKKIIRIWHSIGPGLVTGASDDDPSAITTYSQAGAIFGLATLWTAIFAYPLLASMQEICARIGLVSNKNLPEIVKSYYPKWLLYMVILISCPGFILNIGADIACIGAVSHLLLPKIPAFIFSTLFAGTLIVLLLVMPYRRFEQAMKLICLALLGYVAVPFFIKQDWTLIIKSTFYPTFIFSRKFLLVLTGLIGSILSPYVFFWQTSTEVETLRRKNPKISRSKFTMLRMRIDILFGSFFAVLIMYFILLTAGTILYKNHINNIQYVQDAAAALKPFAGSLSYLLFSIGILGTGFLIIPVLASTVSYMFSGVFNWAQGLEKKFSDAKSFYYIIILAMIGGLIISFFWQHPVRLLLLTTVSYGVTTPVLIAIILHIANNKKVMGERVNHWRSNLFGFLSLIITSAIVVCLLFSW
ncbi:MAG: Nramp family divalent metal transporter [Bacteroidota bacterium]|nr:Nramp family divalent metal transporter [Bacteroidota bacterium]